MSKLVIKIEVTDIAVRGGQNLQNCTITSAKSDMSLYGNIEKCKH